MTYDVHAGKVQTVLGPIDPDQLGVTLTHEHLLVDLSEITPGQPSAASERDIYHRPVSAELAGLLRQYAWPNRDNSRLLDIATATREAQLYRMHGGDSMVDATSIGIARDPLALARISRAAGVNVIMGASYYVDAAHPPEVAAMDEDDVVRRIVGDLTEGVNGTGIRSGVIGEVGCSWPLTENERKVLRASGRAQRLTGAPLLIHPGRDETAPLEIIDVLAGVGADLGHTIMGHLDRTVFVRDTLDEIAESGCFLEWDLFGREQSYYWANPKIDMPGDGKRMDDIAWIAQRGYGDRVVLAHDVCSKDRLFQKSGHGYHYILARVVPRMLARGFDRDAVHRMLVDNPAAALRFTEPP